MTPHKKPTVTQLRDYEANRKLNKVYNPVPKHHAKRHAAMQWWMSHITQKPSNSEWY